MKTRYIFLTTLILLLVGTGAFYLLQPEEPLQTSEQPEDDDGDNTGDEVDEILALKDAPFPVGAAIQSHYLKDNYENSSIYKQTLLNDFNSISGEYEFKQRHVNREQGKFDFNATDYLMEFAENNSMRVHGHTLLWHSSLPDWMEELNNTEFEAEMKAWITAIMTRYKGQIAAWDVLNEAVAWEAGEGFILRNSTYLQKLGPDYIADVFRFAHSIDPDALLFYNDFHLYFNEGKLDKVIEIVSDLLVDGVPIHGVGLQLHYTKTTWREPIDVPAIQAAMKRVADLGLKVHISELDVTINNGSYNAYTDELRQEQRRLVEGIVEGYLNLPETAQYGITLWGLIDPHSWQNDRFEFPVRPLLFDGSFEPKPSYYGFLQTLQEN